LGINFDELLELDNSNASSEILMIEREISALKCKHDFIQLSILALEFEYDQNWQICFVVMAIGLQMKIIILIWRVRRESKAILTTVKSMKISSQNRKNQEILLKLILMRY
jgi:hypothetical protein